MTDDQAAADPEPTEPDGVQALALTAIRAMRGVLDLAERAARDPQGAVRVMSALASFAKMAFESVGTAAPSADRPSESSATPPSSPDTGPAEG